MLAPIFIGASMPNHMFMGVLFIRGMIYTPITKEFPTPTRKMKLNSKRFCLGDLISFDFS